jgi:UDP-N-acetylmuramoylalanine--D-glutamate ligase
MFVCEVSSFQMETAETFRPRCGALLNITEDHLNRHGTMENYALTKMRMFQNMNADDVAVFNADDPALVPYIPMVKTQVMLFSRKAEVENGAFVRDGVIVTRFGGVETVVCPAADVYIPGPHNLENALAACCMATACGVEASVIAQTLRTFTGVEHRIEFVRELEGVRYINDSKGTNVDSTIKAIQTMNRPTAIILGGYDKHCDFTPMVKEMLASPHIREAVLIGETANQIEKTLLDNGYTAIHRAATLEEAINTCRTLSSDGWNVLLSPACASFDMFADYEARGRIFKELVMALR